MPIIKSLLDNDFYTFTVGMAAYENFPSLFVEYEFKCRNRGIVFDEAFNIRLNRELNEMNGMTFTDQEIRWLISQGGFTAGYIEFLRNFRFERSYVRSSLVDGDFELGICGNLPQAIMYEVVVLALINQIYFEQKGLTDLVAGREILNDKISNIIRDNGTRATPVQFIEFGTRRRRSVEWHEEVFTTLSNKLAPNQFLGTSNALLAMASGTKPIGTQSHQWFQIFQATGALQDSVKNALDAWLLTHRGRFAIALTDIVGSQAFYDRLDPLHWNAYQGFRGDSGDNQWWLSTSYAMMQRAGVDPKTKTMILSNGLDVEQCFPLFDRWGHAFKNLVFAIGTRFTNDFPDKALNIVIKLVRVNGMPVAKLSDDPGKKMCKDPNFVTHLRKTFGLNETDSGN